MFMRCATHEGRTAVVGAGRLDLRWTFGAHEGSLARVWGSPVIAPDGTLYVVTNGYVRALGPDGASRWALQDPLCTSAAESAGPTPAYTHGFVAPALGEDGTVYAACTSKLVAIDPATGGVRWSLSFAGRVSSPTLTGGGIVVVTTAPESVVAVSLSGSMSWSVAFESAGEETPLPPAVGPDGTIYVAFAATNSVHAVSPDGAERWSAQAGAGGVWAPLVVATDRLYVSSSPGGCLEALDLDGGAIATFACAAKGVEGPPAVGADGTVFGTGSNAPRNDQELLYALSPSGAVEWAAPDGSRGVAGFPIVGGDGTIYAPGGAGGLYAFAPDGGGVWEKGETTFIAGSPAIASDGTVYAMDAEGVVYAFGP
jgi:outer membrane protein assembly factor BamB